MEVQTFGGEEGNVGVEKQELGGASVAPRRGRSPQEEEEGGGGVGEEATEREREENSRERRELLVLM